jgi:hypothetical protein
MATHVEHPPLTPAAAKAQLEVIVDDLAGLVARILVAQTAADPDDVYGWGIIHGLVEAAQIMVRQAAWAAEDQAR